MNRKSIGGKPGTAVVGDAGNVDSLTAFRGILALWVTVGHFWNHIVLLVPGLSPANDFLTRGQMAVPGFFILSGWVLARNYSDWFHTPDLARARRFWALRLARIYPVHLATIAFLGVSALVACIGKASHAELRNYALDDLVYNLLLVHAWGPRPEFSWNFPSWSISAEWLAYLLFPLLSSLFWSVRRIPGAALFLMAAGMAATLWKTMWYGHAPFGLLILVVAGFMTGMGIHWSSLGGGRSRIPSILPDATLVVMVASCLFASQPVSYFLLCACPAVAIWSFARLGDRCTAIWRSRPLLVLGEVSYSLYMSHALVEKFVVRALPPQTWAGRGTLPSLAVVAAYVAAVGVATAVCYAAVERPARRRLRTLLQTRSGTAEAVAGDVPRSR